MSNPDHPLWHLCYTVAVILALSFSLWLNASSFDKTELKTILEFGVVIAGAKGAELLVRKKGKDE